MKQIKINTNLPVLFYDFEQDKTNEKFTRGKLKTFYTGETDDHRVFNKEFSQEIIKTLPYTPVVSKYSEEDGDFVGHASEQQIYGIVDPKTEVTFIEENGKTWAVCDVVLYTERPDKTGEIAKKIIGKSHSLEMDPNTIQYKINYDSRRRFKNIEFTYGEFVGVSVLGDKQKPAFTGSCFFEENKDFEEKMNLLRNYCLGDGEKIMEEQILNFVELSWGEKYQKISASLNRMYGYNYNVIDLYDDYVIAYIYDEEKDTTKMMKINYAQNENEVILATAVPVRVTYEEIITTNSESFEAEEDKKEKEEGENKKEEDLSLEKEKEEDCSSDKKDEDEEDKSECLEEVEESFKDDEDKDDKDEPEDKEDIDEKDDEDDDKKHEMKKEKEEDEDEKTNSDDSKCGSTTPDNSEEEFARIEKERAEKLKLILDYSDCFSKEEIENYKNTIDQYSVVELELEFARSLKKNSVKNVSKYKNNSFQKIFLNANEKGYMSEQDEINDLVATYKNKR